MHILRILTVFWLFYAHGSCLVLAQKKVLVNPLPELPALGGKPNPGVAGAFAGISNGILLLAGGTNFPSGYPWQGGLKVWYATIYSLDLKKSSAVWEVTGRLARPLANGASVVWHEKVICIGGNDAQSKFRSVFALTANRKSGQVTVDSLPRLPIALAHLSATVAENLLYVFGGESERGTEKMLFELNLEDPTKGWKRKTDLPASGRACATLTAVRDSVGEWLCLVGGRQTTGGKTTVFPDVFAYRIQANRWEKLAALPQPLASHSTVAIDEKMLLVVGGDNGKRLREIETLTSQLGAMADPRRLEALTKNRNSLQMKHPGYERTLLTYQAGTRSWAVLDTLTGPVPVMTTALRSGKYIILPGGEISPGIQTSTGLKIDIKSLPEARKK